MPVTTAADNNFFIICFYFSEKTSLEIFMWIVCLADDSHEMSRLVFSEKQKNFFRISSATNFAWRFKGWRFWHLISIQLKEALWHSFYSIQHWPWSCSTRICPAYANSVDPDQLASTLFVIKYVNLYQQTGSTNLIGWKLEVEMAS